MLAGQGGGSMFSDNMVEASESMFQNLGGMQASPDAQDMEREHMRAQYNKHVKFAEYHVKTFDTSKSSQRAAYELLMQEIFNGLQAKTHVVFISDRRFVETDNKPRWLAYVEWGVFELEVVGNPAVPPAAS